MRHRLSLRARRTRLTIAVLTIVGAGTLLTAQTPEQGRAEATTYTFYASPGWSPDGKRLAFRSQSPSEHAVWVVDADGSNARMVTRAPAVAEVDWAPRGKLLAYTWARGQDRPYQVAVVSAAGGAPRTLAPGFDVDWSPRGDRLAFVTTIGGGAVETITPNGTQHQKLTRVERSGFPEWSPSGHAIAFSRLRAGEELAQPFVVRRDGSGLRPLRKGPGALTVWSPNGREIAFIGRPKAKIDRRSLWLVRPNGSHLRPIVAASRAITGSLPSWSRRGWIAFTRSSSRGYVVNVVRQDGRGLRSVGPGEQPAWSPDGRSLAVVAYCNSAQSATTIYVMADGRSRRPLLPCPATS